MLYTRIKPRRDELATQRLTRATELAPLDVVAWLELAKVHESALLSLSAIFRPPLGHHSATSRPPLGHLSATSRPPLAKVHESASSLSVALKAYEKAAALLKRAQKLVPVELWNNLGVLRQRLGKLDSAEAAYSAAARLCGGEGASQLAEMQRVTVGYNTARLWEQQGRLEQATAKYVELLQEHPNYVDCFLRLGACEQAVGRPSGALAWLKKGLEVDPVNADLWCALGRVHMEQRDWMRADACFKAVLEKCEGCRKDSYAMLSLANIQLELSAREKHSSRQENALLDKATELYRAVLLQEPNNVFAANGLGVVCAKKGRFAEARSIFTSVRDASVEGADMALANLGQLHALQREPLAAVGLYQKAQRRAKGAPPASLLALEARAHFDAGSLPEARRVLSRALRQRPTDLTTVYNLCVVLHRGAKPARNETGPRPLPTVQRAQADVSLAAQLLRSIEEAAEPHRVAAAAAGLSSARTESLGSKVQKLAAALEEEAALATRRAAEQAEQQREADERIAAIAAEKRQREEEAEEARRAEEERVAALIRENKARLEAKQTTPPFLR